MSRNCSSSVVLCLLCALWIGNLAIAAPLPEQEQSVAGPQNRGSDLALEIKSADGIRYVNLGAEASGPIRLPLLDERRFSAILISTHLEGDKVYVTLAGEKGELETTPIGRYEVPLKGEKETSAVSVAETENLKTGAWQMRVVIAPPPAMPGCCGCTPEYGPKHLHVMVQCCPFTGKCMSCGACGTCCGG